MQTLESDTGCNTHRKCAWHHTCTRFQRCEAWAVAWETAEHPAPSTSSLVGSSYSLLYITLVPIPALHCKCNITIGSNVNNVKIGQRKIFTIKGHLYSKPPVFSSIFHFTANKLKNLNQKKR